MKFIIHSFLITFIGLFFRCGNKSLPSKDLLGKNEEEIIKMYSGGYNTKFFILSDSAKKYELRLLNLFPDYKKDTVHIKELMWEESKKTSVFWFVEKSQKWTVVDDTSWDTAANQANRGVKNQD